MKIDILGVNSTDVVLVECKSRLSQGDVEEFLAKLPRFKSAFPEFATYRIYGAVAGIEIDQGVDRRAYQKGLFVIKPSGDTVAIINDENFQPKTGNRAVFDRVRHSITQSYPQAPGCWGCTL